MTGEGVPIQFGNPVTQILLSKNGTDKESIKFMSSIKRPNYESERFAYSNSWSGKVK